VVTYSSVTTADPSLYGVSLAYRFGPACAGSSASSFVNIKCNKEMPGAGKITRTLLSQNGCVAEVEYVARATRGCR